MDYCGIGPVYLAAIKKPLQGQRKADRLRILIMNFESQFLQQQQKLTIFLSSTIYDLELYVAIIVIGKLMKNFRIQKILDGGLGRQIKRRGYPFKQPEWSAQILMDKPQALVEIYMDFVKNGAEIITTNTYAIVPFHVGDQVFKDRGDELIRIACEQARKVKELNPEKHLQIAFSVPPIFGSYRPDLFKENQTQARELYEKFLEPSHTMDYIDFYLCETLSSVREATLLMELLQKSSKPYCLSFTFDDETQELRDKDEKIEALAEAMSKFEKKPEAVMVNCTRPEKITGIVQRLRSSMPKEILVGCYPNNFEEKKRDNYDPKKDAYIVRQDLQVEEYEKLANSWIQSGAEIVGGCCGIGPVYIPAIKRAFEQSKITKN